MQRPRHSASDSIQCSKSNCIRQDTPENTAISRKESKRKRGKQPTRGTQIPAPIISTFEEVGAFTAERELKPWNYGSLSISLL